MRHRIRPALLASLLVCGVAAPALATGGTAPGTTPQRPAAATPAQPAGQGAARAPETAAAPAPARPAQAATPAPAARRTN